MLIVAQTRRASRALFASIFRSLRTRIVQSANFLSKTLRFPRDYRIHYCFSTKTDFIEMPDRREQLFINLCRDNGGQLSARKRSKFAELDDETIAALEAVIRAVMLDPPGR